MYLSLHSSKLVRQDCGNANERRVLRRDHPGGHCGQVLLEAALGNEAVTEARPVEALAQPRHDAAADINTALRAQRHHQVAGNGAQHAAECLDHFVAQQAFAGERAARDVGCRERLDDRAAVLGQRPVNQLDPGAGHQAFGRHVVEVFPGAAQDRHLGFRHGRKADVAAFAQQRGPAVLARDQAGNAKPGAGADQAQRRAGHRRALPHLALLLGRQKRQGTGQRREIVDHQQGVEVDFAAQRLDRECPVVVGHAHHVAGHRIGNRNGAMADAGDTGAGHLARGQISQQGIGQRGIGGARQHIDRDDLARGGFQREACVGAADVRQQARAAGEFGDRERCR
uniref:Uncharacterized protein n=1 Tax=Tanacetum cinerariifolium TaxID=118510 RepID=A0A699GE11_TANCI|nr:hypothetical protein [Tanacetum cinerariifolium]